MYVLFSCVGATIKDTHIGPLLAQILGAFVSMETYLPTHTMRKQHENNSENSLRLTSLQSFPCTQREA